MIEQLKQVRDALASAIKRIETIKETFPAISVDSDIKIYRDAMDVLKISAPVGVPTCFRSLVKYAEWQMNEGDNYHPTLPSCVAECKAMLSSAPEQP